MVSASVKQDKPFGVCLIKHGDETGHAAEPHTIGTLANIVDWDQLTDGTLGITARGGERFLVEHFEVQQNQLTVGAVTMIPDDPIVTTPAEYSPLVELLRHLLPQAGDLYSDIERDFDNAGWLGCRLAEILPIDLPGKQGLLELTSPLQRLESINEALHQLRKHQST